jgi:hypothetical protein
MHWGSGRKEAYVAKDRELNEWAMVMNQQEKISTRRCRCGIFEVTVVDASVSRQAKNVADKHGRVDIASGRHIGVTAFSPSRSISLARMFPEIHSSFQSRRWPHSLTLLKHVTVRWPSSLARRRAFQQSHLQFLPERPRM